MIELVDANVSAAAKAPSVAPTTKATPIKPEISDAALSELFAKRPSLYVER